MDCFCSCFGASLPTTGIVPQAPHRIKQKTIYYFHAESLPINRAILVAQPTLTPNRMLNVRGLGQFVSHLVGDLQEDISDETRKRENIITQRIAYVYQAYLSDYQKLDANTQLGGSYMY